MKCRGSPSARTQKQNKKKHVLTKGRKKTSKKVCPPTEGKRWLKEAGSIARTVVYLLRPTHPTQTNIFSLNPLVFTSAPPPRRLLQTSVNIKKMISTYVSNCASLVPSPDGVMCSRRPPYSEGNLHSFVSVPYELAPLPPPFPLNTRKRRRVEKYRIFVFTPPPLFFQDIS